MSIRHSHVCVVGGAGFLGSHLCRALQARDCDITVIDDLSVGMLKHLPDGVRLRSMNIVNASDTDLRRALLGVDYVFNYAALPFIPDCFDKPLDFLKVNVLGALRVIEMAAEVGASRILQVSSAEVYGNEGNGEMINEYCPLGPPSTYATTKTAIDSLCVARFKEKGIPVIVLRQFNCLGERETHAYVIPEIIEQIYLAKTNTVNEITIKLGENTKRDFLYAGDATELAIDLLEKGVLGEVYNMGSQKAYNIYEIAQIIANIMRPQETLVIEQDESKKRPAEIFSLCSDNSKLYSVVATRPKVSFEEALIKTITYYIENGCKWDF